MMAGQLHDAQVAAWVRNAAKSIAKPALRDGYKPQSLHAFTDTHGHATHWRIRLKHPDTGDKWIRPMRRDGDGFLMTEPLFPDGKPLYRLHELMARNDESAIVCEGEYCCDALAKLGMLATTSGAANSALAADWRPLAGRSVVIWPDNDAAGLTYAREVTAKIIALNCEVETIDIARLDLPPKGDFIDWQKSFEQTQGRAATMADVEALPKIDALGTPASGDQIPLCTDTPAEESDAAAIARLAALPSFGYERTRTSEAKRLGVRPATLDARVKAARATEDALEKRFTEPEPWPEPIDPAQLLTDVAKTIRRFIVLEHEQADAAALWIAFTWFIDSVEVAPLAIINAPEKACGKSQLLTVFGRLVARPLPAANSSAAFLFRAVELWTPTVLIDEADTFIRENEELKGLVNAGHTRANAYVGRVVGDAHEPKLFGVWGAKAFAGIALEKHLPEATLSRGIIFNLRRKMKTESVERLRHAGDGAFDTLPAKLARFALDYSDTVKHARPNMPEALDDRTLDNWEPLLAIATCAGDAWLARASKAALVLSGNVSGSQSASNELLSDIDTVFQAKRADKLSTTDLIAALLEDEENAWATYNRGKPLAPRQLGRMLSAYGIQSKTFRFGLDTRKGYELAQFSDAFARYVHDTSEIKRNTVTNAENLTNTKASVLPQVLRVTDANVTPCYVLPIKNNVTEAKSLSVTPNLLNNMVCYDVTDKTPFSGGAEGALFDEGEI